VNTGVGDSNAIDIFHHAVSGHGHMPFLVQQITELGICFLKLAPNGEIVDHLKKQDELDIKSVMVQTRSMHSVLELERDPERMT
jgi:hypothetical protein